MNGLREESDSELETVIRVMNIKNEKRYWCLKLALYFSRPAPRHWASKVPSVFTLSDRFWSTLFSSMEKCDCSAVPPPRLFPRQNAFPFITCSHFLSSITPLALPVLSLVMLIPLSVIATSSPLPRLTMLFSCYCLCLAFFFPLASYLFLTTRLCIFHCSIVTLLLPFPCFPYCF